MSNLTITVRPSGATSGGNVATLPAEVDNGNQEIDTKAEAEAALAFLPEGSTNVINVGGRDYTRAQLIEIRDRQAAPAAPAPSDERVPGEGVSHGFLVGGNRTWGTSSNGHTGNRLTLAYTPGIPLSGTGKDSKDKTSLTLDAILGLTFGSHNKGDYSTPGGETVESGFRTYAATAGAHLRITPPIADKRFYVAPGVRFHVGKHTTADGTEVSLPASCKAGDFGRAECEPNAGPRTGNAGTTGLWNENLGAARGTSGLLIGFDALAGVGVRIVKGETASVDAQGGLLYSITHLAPSDGHGLTSSGLGGFLEVIARLGGTDTYVPLPPAATPPPPPPPVVVPVADKDGDGVPDGEDKCPDIKGIKENAGCPAYDAGVTSTPASVKAQEKFLVGLKVGSASKVRISFKSEDGTLNNSNSVLIDEGNSKSEFSVPAELKSGKYKLVITFEDMNTHVKKVEEKDIVIVENVTATLPGSFAPGQPPTIQAVKVVGMEKLEGVTYVIEGFDKDKKSIGTADSTSAAKGDKSWTLGEKTGTRIPLTAPGTKGFQKDVNYVVTLKNKEGLPVWTGSFEVGQTTYTRRRGAK